MSLGVSCIVVLIAQTLVSRPTAWMAAACLWLLAGVPALADEVKPERAQDLRYGWVLYHYHQGQAFDALTQLAVAREQGGIQGHGDHPALVEGGLLLSYGMTREAGRLFIRLLGEDGKGSALAPDVRNQAWFYLGKVLFLEADYPLALRNLDRVDGEILADSDPELYQEWLYLQARLAQIGVGSDTQTAFDGARSELGPNTLWSAYLDYNSAMNALADGNRETAADILASLIDRIEDAGKGAAREASEREALLEKVRLSLARIRLDSGRFDAAFTALEALPVDGPFSDRALFEYAVAAAGQGEMARAFRAIEILSERELFSPWLQQVPYARGYLLEQMNRPEEALAAYTDAAMRYESLQARLVAERDQLTEAALMAQLTFERDGNGLMTDAYGRLRVTPSDFALSEILASESFQQALSELNDLYRMQAFLNDWRQQLASFELMLETRKMQRNARIETTRTALARQQADQWATEYQRLESDITEALARQDLEYFMTSDQKKLAAQLDRVEETLSALPDDASTERQRAKYNRMRAHFEWMIADDYGVNRWAAQKQLRELGQAMSVFQQQRQTIETLMAQDRRHNQLTGRLAAKEAELETLRDELDEALGRARARLMGRVDQSLQAQNEQLRGYLVASRHAQARLADALYQRQQGQIPQQKQERAAAEETKGAGDE